MWSISVAGNRPLARAPSLAFCPVFRPLKSYTLTELWKSDLMVSPAPSLKHTPPFLRRDLPAHSLFPEHISPLRLVIFRDMCLTTGINCFTDRLYHHL